MSFAAFRFVCFSIFLVTPAAAEDQNSNVLADGQSVPPGFVSLKASGPPGNEGARLELVFEDASTGAVVRYRTARGSMSEVKPSENLYYGIYPIDVCVTDAKTGKTLFFHSAEYATIKECGRMARGRSEDVARGAAIKGLQALKSVRFRDEYEPERKYLVKELRSTVESDDDTP